MNIGDRIKYRRNEIGMTLKEVSEKLGVKEATVQRYESGNIKTLKQKTIGKLAEILGTTPAYLMGWEEKKPTTSKDDELKKENLEIFNSLSDDKKHQALDFLRFLQGK